MKKNKTVKVGGNHEDTDMGDWITRASNITLKASGQFTSISEEGGGKQTLLGIFGVPARNPGRLGTF